MSASTNAMRRLLAAARDLPHDGIYRMAQPIEVARAEAMVLREAYAVVRAVRHEREVRRNATPVSGRTATTTGRRRR